MFGARRFLGETFFDRFFLPGGGCLRISECPSEEHFGRNHTRQGPTRARRPTNTKSNVQFSARDGQSNGQYSDTTDAEGRFKIDDVKPGRYMASVDHPGFVQSVSGKRAAFISVQSGQDTTDRIFYMLSAAVITGKV